MISNLMPLPTAQHKTNAREMHKVVLTLITITISSGLMYVRKYVQSIQMPTTETTDSQRYVNVTLKQTVFSCDNELINYCVLLYEHLLLWCIYRKQNKQKLQMYFDWPTKIGIWLIVDFSTQVFHTQRTNLSPFTKDFRVWETNIEN